MIPMLVRLFSKKLFPAKDSVVVVLEKVEWFVGGPKSANLGVSATSENFEALASGIATLYGVLELGHW